MSDPRLAVLLLLAACAAPPMGGLEPTADHPFAGGGISSAIKTLLLATDASIEGSTQMIAAGCQTRPAPWLCAYRSVPRVGEEFVVAWINRNTPNKPQGPAGPWYYPELSSFLLVSLQLRTPEPVIGANGCKWLVSPDWVLALVAGSVFSRQPDGACMLRFVPPPETRGWTFYVQLVVADERIAAGIATSDALRFVIGDQ